MNNRLIQNALETIWYPCSQMKDYQDFPPIVVSQAKGRYLYLENGQKIFDAISSWWCKSLGHGHPRIKQAIYDQLEKFEHIIGTNTVSEALTQLSLKLSKLTPNLNKVFYTGDGSCAVEVAMKMSIHSRLLTGKSHKKRFIALQNGYHGETLATLSVSDVGIYKSAYDSLCFECNYIQNIPYVSGTSDPLWHDCAEIWPQIETQLDAISHSATAIIIEPILQGAGGMKIYSADFLRRLASYAKAHDIHLICDEIMTGFGRTGTTLAIEHAGIQADFICLSKALTGGTLAMSAILTSSDIYDLFYDDYEKGKSFLHSNTYGGNALAAAVANTVVNIHQDENINQQAQQLGLHLHMGMQEVATATSSIEHIRHIGAMVAAELTIPIERAGFKLFKLATAKGAFLRPLGNTIYYLPPLNTTMEEVDELVTITINAIRELSWE